MSNSNRDSQEPSPASHERGLEAHEKPTPDDVRDLLRRGLYAARTGEYKQARRWFIAALEKDRDNIIAMLWLAALATTRREALSLLSRVLELDPKNEHARAGIRWARQRSRTSPNAPDDGRQPGEVEDRESESSPSTLAPEHLERSHLLRELLASSKIQEKARIGITAQRARRFIKPWGLLLGVAACLFGIGVVLVARYSPAAVLAWMLPTPAPTAILLPALSPEPNASLATISTPTPTITHPASPTPPPISTNTPVPIYMVEPTPTIPPPTDVSTPLPAALPPQTQEKWIDVDLTNQQLTAFEGNTPVFQASVSTGLPRTPTVVGQFRIYWKLSATDMAGPGYYLPAVPYTMYFYGGYALHGTYWHSNFGRPMSHGCVNLRTEDALWLFNWADPPIPTGASQVRSSRASLGTRVVVHE